MSRMPMSELVKFAAILAKPEMERRSYWRNLVGRNHWMLVLISHGKPGDPPEKPLGGPTVRISPEWLRRTGGNLGPEDLLYERIYGRLKAHVQDESEVDVAYAAGIVTDTVLDLARSGEVDLSALVTEQPAERGLDDDQARRLAHPRTPKPLPYGSIDGDKTMRDFMTDLHDVSGIGDPTLRRRIAEGLWVMGYERQPYKAIVESGEADV